MLRFYDQALRAVVTEALSTNKPIVLTNDNGVYLSVDGGETQSDGRKKHRAYAEGCHPTLDPEWSAMARILTGSNDLTKRLMLTEGALWDIIAHSHQLTVAMSEKGPEIFCTERNYVPVAEYRHLADRMDTMTMAHFSACVGPKELSRWREMAQALFSKSRPVSCRRAQRRDHYQFILACKSLHSRMECVSHDGVLLTKDR